jgi:plastocyanin
VRRLIFPLVALVALVGVTVTSAATTTVVMTENYFWNSGTGTRVVRINPGDTVTWENRGQQFHDVTFTDGGSGPVGRNGTWSRTFTVAGSYEYTCTLHEVEGMTGRVEVGLVATPTPTSTPTDGSTQSRLLVPYTSRAGR